MPHIDKGGMELSTRTAPKTLAKRIARIAYKKKAEQIVLLDLRKLTSMTDYFLICSAGSEVHAKVIAESIMEGLDESIRELEGLEAARWILIDCGMVVVHIFRPEVREYYALERLWGEAPREEFEDGI